MNIRLLLLFLIVFGLSKNTLSQKYVEYYNIVNQASKSYYEKNYSESLELYEKAFNMVEFVHSINYFKAARSAAKLKKYNLTFNYLREAILQGYPESILEIDVFKAFRKTDYYKSLLDIISDLKDEHLKSIDNLYLNKIDSLYYIDQTILRNKNVTRNISIDTSLIYSDSLNIVYLLNLVEVYGFPSERKVGYEGYGKVWVIFHHSLRLPQNHKYQYILLDALKQGEYLPENYCWVVDQGNELLGEELTYYHWDVAKNIGKLSRKEKDLINRRRFKVGMPSIERIKTKKVSGEKVNVLKW